jgi:hypothetical protein
MKATRNVYKILVGKPEGRNHSEGLGVDTRIILEWILENEDGKFMTGTIGWLL